MSYHRPRIALGRWLLGLALAAAIWSTAPPAWAARPARLESDHFTVSYDPDRLTAETARGALAAAERGYEHCREVFGHEPPGRILCDLTPRFTGATGYAVPSARPLRIAVRYADLDYLGLSGPYVLTHEIAHIFSGQNAAGPFGEGLADFVAGSASETPLAPWWGRALRENRVWTDVDGLFISGEYPAANELDARVRVSQYVQPALLLQFLVRRFGFERVERFLPAYSRARHSLASNEAATPRPAGPPGQRLERPRRPDAAKVRALFQEQFGAAWERLRDDWLAEMDAATLPEGAAERLVLAQEIYATIRGYEGWLTSNPQGADDPRLPAIRAAFTRANRALRERNPTQAAEELRSARLLIDRLRRPSLTAEAEGKSTHPSRACRSLTIGSARWDVPA
jgi:hypothetical protein